MFRGFFFYLQCEDIVKSLTLSDDQVSRVMETLQSEMWLGLSRDPEKQKMTSLQMENTYVRSLLDGTGKTTFKKVACHFNKWSDLGILTDVAFVLHL